MERRPTLGLLASIALPVLAAGCSAAAVPAPDARLCIFVVLFGTVLVEIRRRSGPF
ncbi:MAG: hypothetical protein JXR83_10150 [Deltaproteobacteria bacterium]|nr:hypothetical protein [Deltaproteobacteria bacterium]